MTEPTNNPNEAVPLDARERAQKILWTFMQTIDGDRDYSCDKCELTTYLCPHLFERLQNLIAAALTTNATTGAQTCAKCGHNDAFVEKYGVCLKSTGPTSNCGCHCEFPATTTAAEQPLTDAEVDAFLKEHENDPVDEAQSDRIEWLFRKKLGAEWAKRGREYVENYDMLVKGGGGIGRDTEKLYSSTVELIREMVRAIETLALKPTAALSSTPSVGDAIACVERLRDKWADDATAKGRAFSDKATTAELVIAALEALQPSTPSEQKEND